MAKRFAKPIEEIEDELEEEIEEDDEDDDDYEEYEERSRILPFVLSTIALLAFGGLGWYAYQAGSSSDGNDLMLVEAEQTPIKERPLDAGGMQFPYQDKSVFETIAGGEAPVGDSQVVNNTEEPMQPTAAAEINASELSEAPQVAAAEQPSQESLSAIEPAAAPVAEEPVIQEVKEVPVVSVKEVKPVEAPKPAPKAKAAPVASGNQTVQLGAFKSEADASAAWKKVSGFAALSGKSPNIVRADLGNKGIFYRLRVGGVNAKATCESLAGKSPCMVVK